MNNWESHHDAIQQANGNPRQPFPEMVEPENFAARRGIPRQEDLPEPDHPIEPTVVGRFREWYGDNDHLVPVDENAEREERELGQVHSEETDEAIAASGVDAIAYYLPITFYGARRYGIYVRVRRFYAFCDDVQKLAPNATWDDVTAEVWDFILRHEAFHAAVELSCLAGDDFPQRHRACTYEQYFGLSARSWRQWHRGAASPYRCPEEQLAQHAGFSTIPNNPSGIAIKNALIQIFQRAPADYHYDPSDWIGKRGQTYKAKQTQFQRAIHSVQLASLLRGAPPTSVGDVHQDIEPAAWFPPKGSTSVLEGLYGAMPVRVIDFGHTLPLRFARACTFRNIDMRKFINAVCRNCDVTHDEKGGKHPRLIVGKQKHKVTYPRSVSTTPVYVIDQIADLLKISKQDLLTRCQL